MGSLNYHQATLANTVISGSLPSLQELTVMSIPSSQVLHNALCPVSPIRSRHTHKTGGLIPKSKLQPLTHKRNSMIPSPRGLEFMVTSGITGSSRAPKSCS